MQELEAEVTLLDSAAPGNSLKLTKVNTCVSVWASCGFEFFFSGPPGRLLSLLVPLCVIPLPAQGKGTGASLRGWRIKLEGHTKAWPLTVLKVSTHFKARLHLKEFEVGGVSGQMEREREKDMVVQGDDQAGNFVKTEDLASVHPHSLSLADHVHSGATLPPVVWKE